jgi:hypothetical protein
MAHAPGLFDRQLEHLFRAGRQFNAPAGVTANPGETLDHFLHPSRLKPELAQDAAGHTAFLADQSEEQVLGANVVMVHTLGLFMGQAQHTPRTLREPL